MLNWKTNGFLFFIILTWLFHINIFLHFVLLMKLWCVDLSKLDGKGSHKMQGGRDFGAGPTTKGESFTNNPRHERPFMCVPANYIFLSFFSLVVHIIHYCFYMSLFQGQDHSFLFQLSGEANPLKQSFINAMESLKDKDNFCHHYRTCS